MDLELPVAFFEEWIDLFRPERRVPSRIGALQYAPYLTHSR